MFKYGVDITLHPLETCKPLLYIGFGKKILVAFVQVSFLIIVVFAQASFVVYLSHYTVNNQEIPMFDSIPYLIPNLFDDKQLHVPKGAKIGIIIDSTEDKPKYPKKPSFKMAGDGMKNRYAQAYPLLNTMCDFSKPEAWFFKILLDAHAESTGLSSLIKISFTKTEIETISKAYKLLNQRDLVRRFKRQVYMINPNGLITNHWEDHHKVWESLAPKPPKVFQYINPKHLPRGFWIKSYKTYNRATGTYIKP